MFAGGTGIGTRTLEHFYYREELERLIATGNLQLRVAFSAEDITARSEDGFLITESGSRTRLPEVMEREDNAEVLCVCCDPQTRAAQRPASTSAATRRSPIR
jgi:hypothetical protein